MKSAGVDGSLLRLGLGLGPVNEEDGSSEAEGGMADRRVISNREYKVMLDHRLFLDRKPAVEAFGGDLHSCATRLKKIACRGEFTSTTRREIVFLDTADQTIALNEFVFRQRTDLAKETTEYTLKCRSPDRYIAAAARVESAGPRKGKEKFEEDIGAPFVVRFSHSNTVEGLRASPRTLRQAAKIFPALGRLKRDEQPCSPGLELRPANSLKIFERVLKGPVLRFDKVEAEVALILWSDGEAGRPIVAEFSFRYGDEGELYDPKAARRALEFFTECQRMDWCLPGARTKTQFVYEA